MQKSGTVGTYPSSDWAHVKELIIKKLGRIKGCSFGGQDVITFNSLLGILAAMALSESQCARISSVPLEGPRALSLSITVDLPFRAGSIDLRKS